MAKCLVTGGAGFIGSHLVDVLLAEGYDVRVLDNFSTGERRNLLHLAGEIDIFEGELRSFDRVLAAARDCEVVFHQAALPSVPRSIQDPFTTSEVNITGTLNVLLAARDLGVRRVVYASSSSVYGALAGEQKREDLPVAPLSPYGVSKHSGEEFCLSFRQAYGLETVCLRYFNVFGPRQSPYSEYAAVIPNFMAAAVMDERPAIYGDGEQSRDFTFVEDVVKANILAAGHDAAPGQVFNIAYGGSHTLHELLTAVSDLAGRALDPIYEEPRTGEVRHSRADITKARELLGYEPRVDFHAGLRRTYESFVADESLIPRVRERRSWISVAR